MASELPGSPGLDPWNPGAVTNGWPLTGRGQPFELVEELVLGERVRVLRDRPRSLRELLERSARFGSADYLVFGDRRISYLEHHQRVAGLAAALTERFGIGPGDRVAVLAGTSPEWIISYWATTACGAVLAACNSSWLQDEVAHALAECQPSLVIVDAEHRSRLDESTLGCPVVEIEAEPELFAPVDRPLPVLASPIAEDDPAGILFTSGTTGRAKAALHSHRNTLCMVSSVMLRNAQDGTPLDEHGVMLCTSPLFHLTGLHAGAILSLATGMKAVWPVGRFDPEAVLRLIEAELATTWLAPGTLAWRVVNHPDATRYDLSSMRSLSVGAGAISPSLLERIGEVFTSATTTVGNSYGLTESTGLGTRSTGIGVAAPTSVGRATAFIDVEIRDDRGVAQPDGEVGEICLRGPSIMLGYRGRPEATQEAFWPGRWLRTGDIGWLDDGELHLATRRSDLIVRGGENVYPTEVEQCLDRHPAVAETAVVGVPDPEWGQVVRAIVVPVDGAEVSEDDLRTWTRTHLAAFKTPARWDIRTRPLPRTATGKVMRAALRTDDDTATISPAAGATTSATTTTTTPTTGKS